VPDAELNRSILVVAITPSHFSKATLAAVVEAPATTCGLRQHGDRQGNHLGGAAAPREDGPAAERTIGGPTVTARRNLAWLDDVLQSGLRLARENRRSACSGRRSPGVWIGSALGEGSNSTRPRT